MMAIQFAGFDQNKKIIDKAIDSGVFTDWFLFASDSLRICPPLNITENEIIAATEKLLAAFQH